MALQTINAVKDRFETDAPLLLFECTLPSGQIQRWSTASIEWKSQQYEGRVLRHSLFDFQLSSEDAMDGIAKVSLSLANADSLLSQLQASIGFKGSSVVIYLIFADLTVGEVTTEEIVLFRGTAGDPEEITEDSFLLSFTNKLNLQRIALPDVRIQRMCPWVFPTSLDQRQEAQQHAYDGDYSRFSKCGYAADIADGMGNLNNGQPFQSCDHTRKHCVQRGMFDIDSSGKTTRRFGGVEFVPSSVLVRTHGERTSHLSAVLDNAAKYNDPAPLVYGMGWLKAPVILARNDGNLTRMEVLIGAGSIHDVLKVVVNSVEIPIAHSGLDTNSTGSYSWVTKGSRQGGFNSNFTDENGQPVGDPYGSLAVLAVNVPNAISDGRSLPVVEVLVQGLELDQYDAWGSFTGRSYTNNPGWIVLDILRRCGVSTEDIDLASVAAAAQECGQLITTTDIYGNTIQVPRFQCNLMLTKRKSASEVLRGIRVGSNLMVRLGNEGKLQLLAETTLSRQHPSLPDGSNSVEPLGDGWPAYEFSDGSRLFSGIARRENGASSVRLISRTIAETSNRLSVEFQDEGAEFQQESLSVVDNDDSSLIGYELSSQSTALGIANFSQATRVLQRQLNKLTRGNRYIEFETSFRALKIRPGDLISVTYQKELLDRTIFRVQKLSPTANYRRLTILAQIHEDFWYSDDPTSTGANGRQPSGAGQLPRPLIGDHFDEKGRTQFSILEQIDETSDGSAMATLNVQFSDPARPALNAPALPTLGLSPAITGGIGTLRPGTNYYYCVSAVDGAGNEGAVSYTIRASLPQELDDASVTLTGLGFPSNASNFNVYRGETPQRLFRIAANQPLAKSFEDQGFPATPFGPPDQNFDHANFYFRKELSGPWFAEIVSDSSIGNPDMGSTAGSFEGMTVRIIDGVGMGQERRIVQNDGATLKLSPSWSTGPNRESQFVITESGWRFGAVTSAGPARFQVPNQGKTVIQVSGRAANSLNQEAPLELSPITRWSLGGGAGNTLDLDSPPSPNYVINTEGQGTVLLSAVSFQTAANTRSISAGTLQLWYQDELAEDAGVVLTNEVSADLQVNTLYVSRLIAQPSDAILIDAEIMIVLSVDNAAGTYQVSRQGLGSRIAGHVGGVTITHLSRRSFVTPFARDFFSQKSSQNYFHTVSLPDVRVIAAEYWVTNSRGESSVATQNYLSSIDAGLRTLSGGQLSLQVGGSLAIQQNAGPSVFIEASHSIKDVRANVNQAPTGSPITLNLRNGDKVWCTLTISAESNVSEIIDGKHLNPLRVGTMLSLDILAVGSGSYSNPGKDLTITIRL